MNRVRKVFLNFGMCFTLITYIASLINRLAGGGTPLKFEGMTRILIFSAVYGALTLVFEIKAGAAGRLIHFVLLTAAFALTIPAMRYGGEFRMIFLAAAVFAAAYWICTGVYLAILRAVNGRKADGGK